MTARRIDLYAPIGGWFGFTASEMKYQLDAAGGAEVELHIHSDGGCCFEGFAIANVLGQYAGKKTAVIDGMCGSAAVGIALMCDERRANRASMWMTHVPWAVTQGNAEDHEANGKVLRQITDCMVKLYMGRTGKDEATVRGWMTMGRDTYFTPDEALAAGLATTIVDLPVPANAQAEMTKFLNQRKTGPSAARTYKPRSKNAVMNYLEKLGLAQGATPEEIAAAVLSYCAGEATEEEKKSTLAGLVGQLRGGSEPDGDEGAEASALRTALAAAKDELAAKAARITELETQTAAAAKANEPTAEKLADEACAAGRWPAAKKAELVKMYQAGGKPYLFDAGTFSPRNQQYIKGGNPSPQPQTNPPPAAAASQEDDNFLARVNARGTLVDPKAFAAAKAAARR